MKKNLLFIGLLTLSLFLSSCKKTINGTITDNFNQPVENARVYILNTAFEDLSNSNGKFNLDYAPGMIDFRIKKDGYYNISRPIQINEHSNYPLGDILMIRYPEYMGLYFKADTNYIQIPEITLELKSTSKQESYRLIYFYDNYLIPNPDSVFSIKVKSLENIEMYSFSDKNWQLTGINKQNVVVVSESSNLSMGNQTIKPSDLINEEITKYNSEASKRIFKPEFGKTYVYININKRMYSSSLGKTAFAFKFEQIN